MNLSLDPDFCQLLSGAYARLVAKPLIPVATGNTVSRAQWLYRHAPFCVLAHNTGIDPIFIYANRSAQICFGYNWDEITSLPSRLSAEAPDQADRQRLLNEVSTNGFISNYRGMRIAKSGRRFWIENATVWQLTDESGMLHGQAAMFQEKPLHG